MVVPAGVTIDDLAEAYPRLYHMAHKDAWPSIQRYGLLSTTALLDLFRKRGHERALTERRHRPEPITIHDDKHGTVVIRDQKPMSDRGLRRALPPTISPERWYRLLNRHVFFWLTEERLQRLLTAKAYRADRHLVLQLDSRSLLDGYEQAIVLSSMNSGCTRPWPWPRDFRTFAPLSEYRFAEWRQKRGLANAAVELAVRGGISDVTRYVLSVTEVGGGKRNRMIWSR